jgi:prepilin-type N-terminal cleavage/methylation domain-containing protein
MVSSMYVRRSRGFTLVEILVVMAILAALSLVAIPWFMKLSQRYALKSGAREIATTLAAARMTAVKLNQPVSVVLLSITPPIQIAIIEPAPPAPTPTKVPQLLILPQNAVRMFQTPSSAGGTITFGGDGRLSAPVLPALTPNAVMIVDGPVNSSPRNQIQILTSAAGRVQVVTPVDWQ